MAVKAVVFLEDSDLEALVELTERKDCPPVVVKLIKEIEMWKETVGDSHV